MPTTTPPAHNDRRARRRILGWGALAVGLVAAAGAVEGIPRAERDLERRVGARLEANGISGVHVSFSGQDGTLRCDEPLTDPDRAVALAEDLWGVRVAEADASCIARAGGDQGSGATATATTDAAPATSAPASTAPPSTAPPSTSPPTTAAPSTVAPTSAPPTTVEAAAAGDVIVTLDDGRLVLTGTVADDPARAVLVDAASTVVDPANVDDQLLLAGSAGADEVGATADELVGLVELVGVMPANLVSGTATRSGDGSLDIVGVVVDAAASEVVQAAIDTTGAEATLTEREVATATDAARLTDELNAFVAANPILFEPGRATLTPEAGAVVDQVAAIANRYAGVAIEIIGHTDSDGSAERNFELSAQRAATVRTALIERGVTAPLSLAGLGESQPVLVNGVEDKAASRRVVFEITAA